MHRAKSPRTTSAPRPWPRPHIGHKRVRSDRLDGYPMGKLDALLLLAACYCTTIRAFQLQSTPAQKGSVSFRRNSVLHMLPQKDPFGDSLSERDPEVERATGGGWRSLLGPVPTILAITAVTALSAATPLGDALSSPMFRTEEITPQLDDAGTPYGPSEQRVPTGGLLILVAYQLFARIVRPRLEAAARERRGGTRGATDDESDNGDAST
jgi:hypothetical protein